MEINPFYTSPVKEAYRPVKILKKYKWSIIKKVEAAQEIGYRMAAKLFRASRSNIQRWIKQLDSFLK